MAAASSGARSSKVVKVAVERYDYHAFLLPLGLRMATVEFLILNRVFTSRATATRHSDP